MVTFKSSGALGDIVMGLPAIRSLANGEDIKLFLQGDLPDKMPGFAGIRWPVRMPEEHAKALIPLLQSQGIKAELWKGQIVQYDLDAWRTSGFDFGRGDLSRYLTYTFHKAVPDFSKPWINVEPDKRFKNKIVVNRTQRYHRPLRYDFLKERNDVVFVGLADEHIAFSQMVPDLRRVEVKDYLELARVVRGSKLFIGNQSFPWCLAQAIDIKRVLEIYPLAPNAAPTSTRGRDCWTQEALEYHVKDLLGENEASIISICDRS